MLKIENCWNVFKYGLLVWFLTEEVTVWWTFGLLELTVTWREESAWKRADLIKVYKIVHGHSPITFEDLFEFDNSGRVTKTAMSCFFILLCTIFSRKITKKWLLSFHEIFTKNSEKCSSTFREFSIFTKNIIIEIRNGIQCPSSTVPVLSLLTYIIWNKLYTYHWTYINRSMTLKTKLVPF